MKRSHWGVACALVALALATFIPQAHADGLRGSRLGANRGTAVRSAGRSVQRNAARSIGRSVQRSGNSAFAGRSGARLGRNSTPSFSSRGSGRSSKGYQGAGRGALGGLLREGLQHRLGDRDGYGRGGRVLDYLEDRDDHRSDAYRDALIANTIVQIAGIVATAPRYQGYYAAPRSRGYYAAPPPRVVAPAPGHYETRRVIVREGYWQNEQVWVPEWQDPSTGAVVEGHYEVHKRWVPEVYEETQVWVPHQTPIPYGR